MGYALIHLLFIRQQHQKFLGKCNRPLSQSTHKRCKITEIACVGKSKGYALPTVTCHIQSIVPVCTSHAIDVMAANFKKPGQVLNEQVFQDGSNIDFSLLRPQVIAVSFFPKFVHFCAAGCLLIFKISCSFVQDIQIAGLINV